MQGLTWQEKQVPDVSPICLWPHVFALMAHPFVCGHMCLLWWPTICVWPHVFALMAHPFVCGHILLLAWQAVAWASNCSRQMDDRAGFRPHHRQGVGWNCKVGETVSFSWNVGRWPQLTVEITRKYRGFSVLAMATLEVGHHIRLSRMICNS